MPHAWARLSIAAKLPLALVALLSVAFGGMIAVAYLQVRASALAVASERLAQAGGHMASLLGTSAEQRLGTLQAFATRADLPAYLTDPSGAAGARVEERLRTSAGSSQLSAIEIWDATPRRLLATGFAFPELPARVFDESAPNGGRGVGEFGAVGNAAAYHVTVPIDGEGSQVLGYLVERRRVMNAAEAVSQLTRLIGADATLAVGNLSGSLWTDLTTTIDMPLGGGIDTQELLGYRRGGRDVLARAASIANTPWLVVVEFTKAPVLAPAQRFLYMAMGVSALLIAAGAAAGWVMSRRLTRPLQHITDGAAALAASRTAPRIPVTRADEVGRLAASFNVMAEQVDQARQRLEVLVKELELRVEERTAALLATNRELEAFSYSVSHDLRAPVRVIDGFAKILREDHHDALAPDARHCIDVIVRRTKEMGQLIDDLLTFSRLGRHPLTRGPIDMTALAESVAEEARAAAEDRELTCTVGTLPPAYGERTLIKQVLTNLVDNAVKFTRTRAVTRIEIGAAEQHGETVYFVRDNGVGFDMKYADKLFGVFQRLHPSTEFDGTGVGLAIVQRVVHRHGGRVWAEAVVEGGATFWFTLPPAPVPA